MCASAPAPTRPLGGVWSKTQAADHYGVTTRTIENWIAAGRLTKFVLPSGIVRLDAAEVRALARSTGDAA